MICSSPSTACCLHRFHFFLFADYAAEHRSHDAMREQFTVPERPTISILRYKTAISPLETVHMQRTIVAQTVVLQRVTEIYRYGLDGTFLETNQSIQIVVAMTNCYRKPTEPAPPSKTENNTSAGILQEHWAVYYSIATKLPAGVSYQTVSNFFGSVSTVVQHSTTHTEWCSKLNGYKENVSTPLVSWLLKSA